MTKRSLGWCLSLALASGCASVPAKPAVIAQGAECHPPTWTYAPPIRGWNTGSCPNGREQSPIVIDVPRWQAPRYKGDITISSRPFPLAILNEGFTASVPIPPSAITFTVGARRWDAFEVHFHTKSEHQLAGGTPVPTVLEMHVKTSLQTDATQNAVFAVLFAVDAKDNSALEPIFSRLRMAGPVCTTQQTGVSVDLTPLLRAFEQKPFFDYPGSLTTPECTQGKHWYVSESVAAISGLEVDALSTFIRTWMGAGSPEGINNRGPQQLNTRSVRRFCYEPDCTVVPTGP